MTHTSIASSAIPPKTIRAGCGFCFGMPRETAA
jgi:hypothetical protein